RKVFFELSDLLRLDHLGTFVLLLTLAREDLHVYHRAFNSRRAGEGSIAYVPGLLAEDSTQQLLFWRKLSLTLRSYFAHEDVTCLNRRADADNAALVEIAKRGLADVGNVSCDLFRSQLRVTRLDLEFLDVDGGVVVLLHHLFRDQDRVLKVVATPRHEGHKNVASQRQLTMIGAGTVCDHLSFHHALAFFDDRLLVNASVLVRTLELCELVNVAAHFARQLHRVMFAFDADNNPLGVHGVDDSVASRQHDRSRVTRCDTFHTGAHDRRMCAQQGH